MILRRLFSAALESTERIHKVQSMILELKLPELVELVENLQRDLKITTTAIHTPTQSESASAQPNAAASATKKEEKSDVNVILHKIDPANKAKLIREIKLILPNLNLVEAKTFVESAPKLIKDKVKTDEANKIKATLEAFGAQIVFE
jgi:ribosomal protein L7/L12